MKEEKSKITNDGEFESGYNEIVRLIKEADGIIEHLAGPKSPKGKEMDVLKREREKDSRYLFSLRQTLMNLYSSVHDYADNQQNKGRGMDWTDNVADISRKHCRIISLERALMMYGNYLKSRDDALELPVAELRNIFYIPREPYFKF